MFYHGVDRWSRNNLQGRVCKQCCEIEESIRIVSLNQTDRNQRGNIECYQCVCSISWMMLDLLDKE